MYEKKASSRNRKRAHRLLTLKDKNLPSLTQERTEINQFDIVFGFITESVFVYDLEDNILNINAAARMLLGLRSRSECIGKPYSQFIQLYKQVAARWQPFPPDEWPMMRVLNEPALSYAQADNICLHVATGRKLLINIYSLPIFGQQGELKGGMCIFYAANAEHIQHTIDALSALVDVLPQITESIDQLVPEETSFTSPHVEAIAQQLTDLIYQQIDCNQALILAVDAKKDRVHFVAMSGLLAEQEHRRRMIAAYAPIAEFLDEHSIELLRANEVVVINRDLIHMPLGIRDDLGPQTMLFLPMYVGERLMGVLVIGKTGADRAYPVEDIALTRAIVQLILIIVGRVQWMNELAATHAHERALEEINQRMNEFLNLASHELKTPLTTVMGNIQLAQRRLQLWKEQDVALAPSLKNKIERIERPLEEAVERARLQKRVIDALLDDSSIQNNTLSLYMRPCDLMKIVRTCVAVQQQLVPQQRIHLELPVAPEHVTIMADADRIAQVIATYLRNAHSYSSLDQPVSVYMLVEDTEVTVFVHDIGPGIVLEEQPHIWERFYRAKGVSVQHELDQSLDLSLGLGLYLCQKLIELHGGKVGLFSDPGQGATFWFRLSILAAL